MIRVLDARGLTHLEASRASLSGISESIRSVVTEGPRREGATFSVVISTQFHFKLRKRILGFGFKVVCSSVSELLQILLEGAL